MSPRPEVLAFPAALSERVTRIAQELAHGEQHAPHPHGPRVYVNGEELILPSRLYYRSALPASGGDPLDDTIRNCLGTRHHDGYLRERCVCALLHERREWVIPFLFAMLGEYVVEIVLAIESRLAPDALPAWQHFAANNPQFLATTRRRAISYWDCYYRRRYRQMADYPALRLLQSTLG